MATATTTQPAVITVEGDQCVELQGIDWKGYSTILRLRGERRVPRIIYCDGELLLVSPSFTHERFAELLGMFVGTVVEELEIPCTTAGSTTFRRRKKQAGVEGDKTFYLANRARIHGKHKIDLRTDPPPDLAIEAVHTHEVSKALEVYRRLRVPEIWVCHLDELRILVRQATGRYAAVDASLAFPYLKASEIFGWVARPRAEDDMAWQRDLRRWVREVLAPRRAGPQA